MATVDATCPKVLNMLVLDSDGRRLGVKYFSPEWWVWCGASAVGGGFCCCPGRAPATLPGVCRMQGYGQQSSKLRESSLCQDQQNQRPARRCVGAKPAARRLCSDAHTCTQLLTPRVSLVCCLVWVMMHTAEIIMFDDYLVVYKQLGDLMFYVTGSLAENELILNSVLTAFYEATSTLLRWVAALREQPGRCLVLGVLGQPGPMAAAIAETGNRAGHACCEWCC